MICDHSASVSNATHTVLRSLCSLLFKSMFGFSKWVIWLIACPNVFRVSYSGQCVCGQFLGQDCLLGWSLSTSLSFG
jgi:hypothetical protein